MAHLSATTSLASHPEEFRYLILALQRQGNRQLNGLLKTIGLTNSQAEAIEIIGEYGPMSTKEVGKYLICESGSPSRLLATLSRKGLTVSSTSSRDRRETLHALSPDGRAVLAEILELKHFFHKTLAVALKAAEHSHPDDLLKQLLTLLRDSELREAMRRRYPGIFDAD